MSILKTPWPRRLLLGAAAVAWLGLSGPALANAFELLSPTESAREQDALARSGETLEPGVFSLSRTILPAIRVLSPALDTGTVKSPVRIELQFQAGDGVQIDPGSFQVLYGMFRVDLTERIRAHADVTEHGVRVENARIPGGSHRLILKVADRSGGQAEAELRFRVED